MIKLSSEDENILNNILPYFKERENDFSSLSPTINDFLIKEAFIKVSSDGTLEKYILTDKGISLKNAGSLMTYRILFNVRNELPDEMLKIIDHKNNPDDENSKLNDLLKNDVRTNYGSKNEQYINFYAPVMSMINKETVIFGMSWKTIKEGVVYTLIAAFIIFISTILLSKMSGNKIDDTPKYKTQNQTNTYTK